MEPRRTPALWRLVLSEVLYSLCWLLVLLLYVPLLLWRAATDRVFRQSMPERLGLVPRSPRGRQVVWIHGVSVGEVKSASTLIRLLRAAYPDAHLVLSTTTPTGHGLARQLFPDLSVIYFPIDFVFVPWLALRRVRPSCVLLLEREFWPNFLTVAHWRSVPVLVVNGRISEKSIRGYCRVRMLLPQFDLIRKYCMQTDGYRDRLLGLAVDRSTIEVTGNMKYDNVQLKEPSANSVRLREWLAAQGGLVFVCGSTHGEEERWLASAARDVAAELGLQVRTVLVPRHPERAPAVVDMLLDQGLTPVLWSRYGRGLRRLRDDDILIVDVIGQLEDFYGACDVAFVGGSLWPRGGQNMLEPAALGRAVAFGPHVFNFQADVEQMLAARAAWQIMQPRDLSRDLRVLFQDGELRAQLGSRAVELIRRNQGSSERTLAAIAPILEATANGATGRTRTAGQAVSER